MPPPAKINNSAAVLEKKWPQGRRGKQCTPVADPSSAAMSSYVAGIFGRKICRTSGSVPADSIAICSHSIRKASGDAG